MGNTPKWLWFVFIGLMAAGTVGCSITIEGGSGSGQIVIHVLPVPHNVATMSYLAKSDSGLGHTRGNSLTILDGMAKADVGNVVTGEWNIQITGWDAAHREIYKHEETIWVNHNQATIVTVFDRQFGDASEHGVFIRYDVTQGTLDRYKSEFDQFIVPYVADATGLWPESESLLIHLYGTQTIWDQHSPCDTQLACFDSVWQDVHVRAQSGADIQDPAVTEAYVYWLVSRVGEATPPFWFITGLARNEAERVQRGDTHWNNPWLQQQWDEIRRSAVLVPALAAHNRADAFTFTAVSHLLQTRGGKYALQQLFVATKSGDSFDEAFRKAFGITVSQYETMYEEQVERVRTP